LACIIDNGVDIGYALSTGSGLKFVATRTIDTSVELWDVKSGTTLQKFNGPEQNAPEAISISPDAKFLACWRSARLQLWSVKTGTPMQSWSSGELGLVSSYLPFHLTASP
jgi:WD40 repeat protein